MQRVIVERQVPREHPGLMKPRERQAQPVVTDSMAALERLVIRERRQVTSTKCIILLFSSLVYYLPMNYFPVLQQGQTGPQGRPGVPGIQGQTGEAGNPGPSGQPGENGKAGADGPAAAVGDAGAQVKSAASRLHIRQKNKHYYNNYTENIEHTLPIPVLIKMLAKTEHAIHTSSSTIKLNFIIISIWNLLQGVQGEAGAKGATGPPGDQGAVGVPGAQGPNGPTGPKGPPGHGGIPGSSGKDGAKGARGFKGEKGKSGKSGVPVSTAILLCVHPSHSCSILYYSPIAGIWGL